MTRERLCWRSDLNTEGSVSGIQLVSMNLVMAGFEFQAWHWTVCAAPAVVVESFELTSRCHRNTAGSSLHSNTQQGCYLHTQHPFNDEFSIQVVLMDSLVQLNLTILVTPKVLLCSSFCFHQLWGEGAIGKERISFCTECQNKGVVLASSKLCSVNQQER